jgi:hypothetical protein
MAGVILTSTHPKALWPGIHAWWGRQYALHPVEFTDLYETDFSEKAYEEEVEITGFGLAPAKPEGTSIPYDSETQGTVTRYTHIAYALGYQVSYEEMQDNLYETVSKRRAQALAFSMAQTKENIAALLFNRAVNSAFTLADGQPALSASHPSLNGPQSNLLTTSSDLSEASIEDLCIQIENTTNNRGMKISNKPQCLHVAPANFFEASRILNSVLQNDTSNNGINVLKASSVFPKGYKVNHYFTSATAWFIRTNIPRGLLYLEREKISFDQDNDFDTRNAKARAYERYSFGMSDWRQLFGTPGV